jgi:hypothetical protein
VLALHDVIAARKIGAQLREQAGGEAGCAELQPRRHGAAMIACERDAAKRRLPPRDQAVMAPGLRAA